MARVVCLLALVFLGSVHAEQHGVCIPEFGLEARTVVIAQSADGVNGLSTPRDLQFHPATGDLWVASADKWERDVDGSGTMSGNYIISNPGTPQQTAELLQDRISFHYQDNMAQFSFDPEGKVLFTCQESENRYQGLAAGPNWFQGPTAFELYPCNGGYGRLNEDGSCDVMSVTQQGDPCTGDDCWLIHSDMLHESPLCMGMAHDPKATTGDTGFNSIDSRTPGHTVWYHDGMRGKLMRFDFDSLHGTAVIDHRYANIRRYVDVDIKRKAGVPGHMVVDPAARHLYVADVGNKRVLRVNPDSGRFLRGAQCVPDECYPTNTNYTCAADGAMFPSSAACMAAGCAECSRDLTDKYQCYAGHCQGGVCAGEDGFGCYTIFTETGDMFEYELWGCTEYEVFTEALQAPSGIALDGMGRVFVSDYEAGEIVAFDKTGKKLGSHRVGRGVSGLEIKCEGGACQLWFVNIETKEVAMLQVDVPCAAAAALPDAPSIAGVTTGYEAKTCEAEEDRTRPNFIIRHGEGYNNRMIVHHAYGKKCGGVEMGTAPADTTEEEQALCPDRTDCKMMNYDLLVMAGFFCHPCLDDPCLNGGSCTNLVRKGFTCDCPAGFSGDRCEVPPSSCPALPAPAAGALVPPACAAGAQRPGQDCTLLCGSPLMEARPHPAAAAPQLVQRCGADGAWSAGGMVCGCISGRFGAECETAVAAKDSAAGVVAASGGGVALASGAGVELPAGALAEGVEISVAEYEAEVADQGSMTARSAVMELRPHGTKFLKAVTLTMKHAGAKDPAQLGAFFWDEAEQEWVEKAGSVVEGDAIKVETDHFSRWVVMEKAPEEVEEEEEEGGGLSAGAWVGIGIGIAAGVVLLGAVFWYSTHAQQPAPANAVEQAEKVAVVHTEQPGVAAGSDFPSHPVQIAASQ